MHYIVVDKNNNKQDDEFGYSGSALRQLGFPQGPYSKAGAETLVRQSKTVNPKLQLVVKPYEGENY